MSRTVIEEDLTVTGSITSASGDVAVKGRVTGDITAKTVDIQLSGEVKGGIDAESVNVQGKQSGQIKCAELSLEKTANVKSDVVAQSLSSEKGAKLVGKVQVTG
ncbi:MAG: polymer-forming cytoskeletal protein [Paracoccaceae bacterium]|nr:polymer-forming cytoskeletal protein [Paracoccaceae bacterium]